MLADVLTKNLPAPDFARHAKVMSGIDPHTSPTLPTDLNVQGPRTTPARDSAVRINTIRQLLNARIPY